MTPRLAVPAALLMPSVAEVEEARARVARVAGDSYGGSYIALGLEASGRPGEVIRALRRGDLEAAARGLRMLAALDLAAAECRDAVRAADTARAGAA